MGSYYLALALHAEPAGAALDEHLDDVLEALIDMDGVEDVDYVVDITTGHVEFTGYVDSDSLDDAAQRFSTTVRAAIHAAEGATPGWLSVFDNPGHVRIEAPEPTPA